MVEKSEKCQINFVVFLLTRSITLATKVCMKPYIVCSSLIDSKWVFYLYLFNHSFVMFDFWNLASFYHVYSCENFVAQIFEFCLLFHVFVYS